MVIYFMQERNTATCSKFSAVETVANDSVKSYIACIVQHFIGEN